MAMRKVTIWNECRHEKEDIEVAEVYPETIGGAIQAGLNQFDFDTALYTLDDENQGIDKARLDETDVLLWWGHRYHGEVLDEHIDYLQQRVLAGMGLIVLHSGHHAKLFQRLMGTSCNLSWREADHGERELMWVLQPGHALAAGLPACIDLPKSEMYGEPFDIPEPDELVFTSWYEGGEVLRSGCVFKRGRGTIFYLGAGHETFPIYRNPTIIQLLANAVNYVAPAHNTGWKLENLGRPQPLAHGAPEQSLFKKPRKR